MKKLAIVTTHPIQYYAPVFRLLHQRGNIELMVFYTWGEGYAKTDDPGFQQKVEWDIDLLDGYDHTFLNNISKSPGSHHFRGIVNPELILSIKNFDPDAVLFIGWAYESHLKAMRCFKGKIPVWFRGDSTLLDKTSFVRKILRSVTLRWVYRHIDHAFYVGKNNKAYFKKYGVKEAQLSFAPHAVDNARFAEDHFAEARQIRQQLHIDDADFMVLFAGKLEPKKDPFMLLEAFRKLNRPNVHLVFAGSGVLENQLKADSQALQANVHFLPFKNQSQMPALYQACDVFCLPSNGPGETWGLAVNEAMAAGKPVVVSDKAGCAEDLVVPAETGYMHQAGNATDLAEKLALVLNDKNVLGRMGGRAQAKIGNYIPLNQVKALEKALCG